MIEQADAEKIGKQIAVGLANATSEVSKETEWFHVDATIDLTDEKSNRVSIQILGIYPDLQMTIHYSYILIAQYDHKVDTNDSSDA